MPFGYEKHHFNSTVSFPQGFLQTVPQTSNMHILMNCVSLPSIKLQFKTVVLMSSPHF